VAALALELQQQQQHTAQACAQLTSSPPLVALPLASQPLALPHTTSSSGAAATARGRGTAVAGSGSTSSVSGGDSGVGLVHGTGTRRGATPRARSASRRLWRSWRGRGCCRAAASSRQRSRWRTAVSLLCFGLLTSTGIFTALYTCSQVVLSFPVVAELAR
jgi:hypothetical protein